MEYRKETLKNGVRLIAVPMPNLESVTAMIGVAAGSRYEGAKVQGLAHFTEHMMFKGTEKRPTTLAISSELDSIGAHFNAATGEEQTVYFVRAEAKNLHQIIEVLTDLVFHSKFDPKEIELEKGVILEELRMYRDQPREWVLNLSNKLLFGSHPLGREIVGTEKTIGGITRDDFLSYLGDWYQPGRIAVCVAGKMEQSEAFGEVEEFLGKLPVGESSLPLAFAANQKEPLVLIEERPTDQTHFVLSLRAYPRNHPGREKLEVLTTILGGGMSSRLFTEVRERRGLAYYIGADWEDFADCGALIVHAGVNNANAVNAIQVALAELKKAKDQLVPEKELKKAKEILRGDLVLGLESTSGACSFFLEQEILENKIETPEEKIKKIDAVTPEDVHKVAQELFVDQGLNLALIGPFSNPEKFRSLLRL